MTGKAVRCLPGCRANQELKPSVAKTDNLSFKNQIGSQAWWPTPLIQASTWETEAG